MKLGELHIVRPHLGNDTLSTTAVRHLIIYIRGDLHYPALSAPGSAHDFRTYEHGVQLVALLQAAFHLAASLDDKESVLAAYGRLLLQFLQQLNLWILGTRYLFHHYSYVSPCGGTARHN